MTRIFEVEYYYDYFENGKKVDTLKDSKSVVAEDAADAILKVDKITSKKSSYLSDETKKRVKTAQKNIDVINVNLAAQSD